MLPRLIFTRCIRCEVVAGVGVGTRAASTADFSEFTRAALPLKQVAISQLPEGFRFIPERDKTFVFQITGTHRQIGTRCQLSFW